MHICPQEIIAVASAIGILKYSAPIIKYWCQECVNGIHKTCTDHAEDTEE